MRVTFDVPTEAAADYVKRCTSHGVPYRVALSRAHKHFGVDAKFLKALIALRKS